MNILPVVSTKGGEGKSTQSANLAGFLADAGFRTLLIDGDHAQPTASNIFPLTYEAPAGLFELLMRTADLSHPDNIISRTAIDGLDLIVSNDPHEQLKTAMLHAPDGRLRLRNVLQHPLFQSYDVIVVDSQGARSVMLEMIVLSATESVVGMVNPVLPDVREFIRGTVNVMENLLPYRELGIPLPKVRTLVNCMDYTALARQTLAELTDIINSGRYSKVLPEGAVTLLSTQIYDLNIYKQGHAAGQPVHRLEKASARRSDSALVTMHSLACELLPEWSEFFDVLLENGGESL
ncbi:Tyrosine-protein kinase CpsD [Salmonella enterica subsp. enterica serovar Typhi]|uniref:ParA family protein n=1 Tax=Salmonella enterica TaxID=28901 RepID=UPI0005E5C617|nr:ParA family protein [Salmonella enterica]CFX36792.1 Tyrosine-protein kinase CpsD [Salmonella enterica subsp. enterica serovar Typhi]CFX49816.1 Tyrosine-protein kinase CpsD [Salmonella enterica subsp. enterica serovar Typhi]CGI23877.1 Tyrosine-protein kinase CpsD [Salmonella enterica subsp. enterica serovar Typhi]CGI29917.1 Tyrosine-protein kinase CpsD [Salmonella enterica subsp. enterica serovar Typhi]CHM33836.1 Tyrosine-protein kinase CpsD [Salmonella enterica subsp. enterica serovar Typhi